MASGVPTLPQNINSLANRLIRYEYASKQQKKISNASDNEDFYRKWRQELSEALSAIGIKSNNQTKPEDIMKALHKAGYTAPGDEK